MVFSESIESATSVPSLSLAPIIQSLVMIALAVYCLISPAKKLPHGEAVQVPQAKTKKRQRKPKKRRSTPQEQASQEGLDLEAAAGDAQIDSCGDSADEDFATQYDAQELVLETSKSDEATTVGDTDIASCGDSA